MLWKEWDELERCTFETFSPLVTLKEDLDMWVLPEILVISRLNSVGLTFWTCIASISKRGKCQYDTWKPSSFTWSFFWWTFFKQQIYVFFCGPGYYCLSPVSFHLRKIYSLQFPEFFSCCETISRWWFLLFFILTPIPGEMIQFDGCAYVSNGWFNQPPPRIGDA